MSQVFSNSSLLFKRVFNFLRLVNDINSINNIKMNCSENDKFIQIEFKEIYILTNYLFIYCFYRYIFCAMFHVTTCKQEFHCDVTFYLRPASADGAEINTLLVNQISRYKRHKNNVNDVLKPSCL